jgi:hypothetical protein
MYREPINQRGRGRDNRRIAAARDILSDMVEQPVGCCPIVSVELDPQRGRGGLLVDPLARRFDADRIGYGSKELPLFWLLLRYGSMAAPPCVRDRAIG